MKRLVTAAAVIASMLIGTAANANTLDVVVHNQVSQGERCKRIDADIAYCAPVDTDYISAYVEMPNKNQLKTDADARASSVANRGSCQEVGDNNYSLNRGKKIEVVKVNVVINGDRIVIGCTFRRTEPLKGWQKPL